jgi:polyisoprenoid-binding protein YceI
VVGDDGAPASVELAADATSLHVREGTGGMKALDDDDRKSIRGTIDDDVLKRKAIEFRSTAVQAAGEGRWNVQGDLTLVGKAAPLAFDLAIGEGGALKASAAITQSNWGIKPYSALFGALKVADEVTVSLDTNLPSV